MPSFDVVCEVDHQELNNAINQALKEVLNRFDFKGAEPEITLELPLIKLSAKDDFKLKALREVLMGKLAKRGINLRNIDPKTLEVSPTGHAKQDLVVREGLTGDLAKTIVKDIKALKLKVQPQSQDQQVRVTGKSRNDLQSVIGMLRKKEYEVGLNFKNMRD